MESGSVMMRCARHIALIGKMVNGYKILVPKPKGKRPLGSGLEDNHKGTECENVRLVSLCFCTLGRLAQVVVPLIYI
jgi:hypothetical protein